MRQSERNARAKSLYKDFSGHDAEPLGAVPFPPNPKSALVIGSTVGIAYETVRDGKVEKYFHRFKVSARPLLVASFDGSQLFLLGGAYNFTERGIEDAP